MLFSLPISSDGGGIYNASGLLTLVASTVADNHVGSGGNGTYSWGGGIYNEGTLTVRQSTISGNSVTAPGEPAGGGIYNALGAMHGTIMVFLAIVPLAFAAFGNLIVPLQIGAVDMAFPRVNMVS